MAVDIEVRQLNNIDELKAMQDLERTVWQMSPMPIHHTYTTLLNGGVILGAYDGEEMIGFLYSFGGFDGQETYLCSHMLGIAPSYRGRGVGLKMKSKQAEIAKAYGYLKITWTFDPLESINAYLNLQKLGARGVSYSENHYGEMDDQLNQGLPTDRIHVVWDLTSGHKGQDLSFDSRKIVLDVKNNAPVVKEPLTKIRLTEGNALFVAIPNHFQMIKDQDKELALEWRIETRNVFQHLFSHKFEACGVYRNESNQTNYYLFKKLK